MPSLYRIEETKQKNQYKTFFLSIQNKIASAHFTLTTQYASENHGLGENTALSWDHRNRGS